MPSAESTTADATCRGTEPGVRIEESSTVDTLSGRSMDHATKEIGHELRSFLVADFVRSLDIGLIAFCRTTFQRSLTPPKNGDDVFDRDDKQQIVGLKIDRDRVLGMEQDLVVFVDRKIFVPFNLNADLHDSTGDRGDLGTVWQHDPATRFLTAFIFSNQNPLTQRFNIFAQRRLLSDG